MGGQVRVEDTHGFGAVDTADRAEHTGRRSAHVAGVHRPCAWHRRRRRSALEALSTAESTYLDVFPDCLIGSFAVPDKRDPLGDPVCFAFYLDKLHLIFIDEGDMCERVLHVVATSGVMKQMTTVHCLFEFMKQLTKDDLEYLADLEDHMEDEEEAMLDRCEDANSRRMLSFRRMLLRIDTYYQQLADMASVIAENESKILTHEESHLFSLFARQAERLLKRSQTSRNTACSCASCIRRASTSGRTTPSNGSPSSRPCSPRSRF